MFPAPSDKMIADEAMAAEQELERILDLLKVVAKVKNDLAPLKRAGDKALWDQLDIAGGLLLGAAHDLKNGVR